MKSEERLISVASWRSVYPDPE